MDLRNLSSTPNQLDQIQRRPSISSLSSASGYASSTYGNTTPQLSNQRINQARNQGKSQAQSGPGGGPAGNSGTQGGSSSSNLQASWHHLSHQQMNNVAPWVEQQAQQAKETVAAGADRQGPVVGGLVGGNPNSAIKSSSNSHPGNNNNNNNSNNSSKSSELNKNANASSTSIAGAGSVNGGNNSTLGGGNGGSGGGAGSGPGDDSDSEHSDDELIPTAIVIKNIPFAIKKEQLLDVMTKLNLPLPYAFNYHFDNGVFRGLAFANFTSTNETSQVVNLLNGREIGGRKLRVEYKKMLPLQERERIEREKREKRGQLEEQHRSTSNASLASLLSTASTTAATKNLSVNGTGNLPPQQTERLFLQFPQNTTLVPPSEINFNDPDNLDLYTQLVIYRDDIAKSVFELAFSSGLTIHQRKVLSLMVQYLNLLEFYDNGMIVIRRKPGQIPISRANLSLTQQQGSTQTQQQVVVTQPPSHSSSMMNLNQFNLGLPPVTANSTSNGAGGVSTHPVPPELLRSHSQSAIPLGGVASSNRPGPSSTPIQSQFPQYSQNTGGSRGGMYQSSNTASGAPQGQYGWQHHSPQPQTSQLHTQHGHHSHQAGSGQPTSGPSVNVAAAPQASTPTSAAALLRSSNNRSFVDVRATPPFNAESPTPQHHHYFNSSGIQLSSMGTQISQPGTPLPGSNDINSRFAPFGQHNQLTGSFTSLHQQAQASQQQQQSQPHPQHSQQQQQQQQHHHHQGGTEEYDGIHQKFNGLKLGQNYDSNSGTTSNSPVSSNSGVGNGNAGGAANTSGSNNGIWGPK